MPSRRTHDLVATIGTYSDANGEKKKRYMNVGSAFTDDDGRLSLKLDAVPVTPEWSGWLSLYPVKDRADRTETAQDRVSGGRSTKTAGRGENRSGGQESVSGDMGEDEDIPW